MKFVTALLLLIGFIAAPALADMPAGFVTRILASHNAERANVGAPPMNWNASLAADAQVWADHLAQTGRFEHSPQPPREHAVGENLWMGTAHAYSFEEMVGGWIDERKDFVDGIFPNVSRTGNWEDVGHYTQLIWADTQEVGCALSSNGADEYLVCRYAKAGNWFGEPIMRHPPIQYARNEMRSTPKLAVYLPD